MKVTSIFTALLLFFSLAQTTAQANVRPVVESFTFTPIDVELASADTNIAFELVVSHPSGIKNISIVATLSGPLGSRLATNLTRNDSPINLSLTKVTFKGILRIQQSVPAGAYKVSI